MFTFQISTEFNLALVIIILSTQLSFDIISKLISSREKERKKKEIKYLIAETNSIDSLVTFEEST